MSTGPVVTSPDVLHPHAIARRVKVGLALFGATAVGVVTLVLTSPAAIVDAAELPDVPLSSLF